MMNQSNPNDWAPPTGIPRPPITIRGGSGPFTNTLGFDPTDYESWPYGFRVAEDDDDDLLLDPSTEDKLGDFDIFNLLDRLTSHGEGPSERRTMEMALRLFLHLTTHPQFNRAFDPRVNGLSHTDIFEACLDTALVWERG